MSFYAEDDESSAGSATSNNQRCHICGGTEFHLLDSIPTCSLCFTQSQTQIVHEVVDTEDFRQIFGEKKKMTLVRQGKQTSGKRGILPWTYYDHRKPLPTLNDCIYATQDLLKIMAKRVALLAGVDRKDVLKEVRSLWFGYLQGWMEAAEVYGEILEREQNINIPRFSIRDAFLGQPRYQRIITFIQKKIRHKLKLNQENPKNLKKENDNGSDDNISSSSSQTDDYYESDESENLFEGYEEEIAMEPVKRFHQGSLITRHESEAPTVRQALDTMPDHQCKNMITRYEAALRSPPSMVLFVSILHRALFNLRAGVSSSHLRLWIMNGAIPYIAAYNALSPKTQKLVDAVRDFFQPFQIPTASSIDYHSELVWIGSGRDPLMKLEENERERLSLEHRTTMIDNAPLMTARFVKDLGFHKRVLDFAYALMGIETKMNMKVHEMHIQHEKRNCNDKIGNKNKEMVNFSNEYRESLKDNGSVINNYQEKQSAKEDKDGASNGDGDEKSRSIDEGSISMRDNEEENQSKKKNDNNVTKNGSSKQDKNENDSKDKINHYTSDWVPPSLQLAQLDHLTCPTHILAIIIIACKLCPDWETWTFKHSVMIDMEQKIDASKESIRSEVGTPLSKMIEKPSQKLLPPHNYVPYKEHNLQYISNGSSLTNFANFATNVFYPRFEIKQSFKKIVSWLESEHRNKIEAFALRSNDSVNTKVLPNPIIARSIPPAIHNPKLHLTAKQIQDITDRSSFPHPDKFQKLPKYKIKIAGLTKWNWETQVKRDDIPVNSSEGLLLEYVCDKFDIDPTSVQSALHMYEYEISYMGDNLFPTAVGVRNMNLRRNRATKSARSKGRNEDFNQWRLSSVLDFHRKRKLAKEKREGKSRIIPTLIETKKRVQTKQRKRRKPNKEVPREQLKLDYSFSSSESDSEGK